LSALKQSNWTTWPCGIVPLPGKGFDHRQKALQN
jgi:hypothetical protein